MNGQVRRRAVEKLSQRLAETVDEMLAEGRVTPEDLVARMWKRHRDLLDGESVRLINAQVWKSARDYCRDVDDEQHELPGLGIPRVLDVTVPDGTYLMKAEEANWAELNAGRQVRVLNVDRAVRRLNRYDDGLEKVRPLMEQRPRMKLRTAMKQLGLFEEPA
jgi:hypothetical protein